MSFLRCILLINGGLLVLLATTIHADETAVQPEVEDESVRQLHQEDLGNWPSPDAAAVFPDDTSLAGLALPGSQPIRPRNQYRRRRKRPRPQIVDDDSFLPVHSESQGSSFSFQEESTQQSQQNHDSSEREKGLNRNQETSVFVDENLQHRLQQHNPYLQELPHTEKVASQEQELYATDNQKGSSTSDKNHYSPKKLADQDFETEEDSDVQIRNAQPQRKYRKPYSSASHTHDSEASVSPQDLKSLLKQQGGSLSLSELLQQKNLSLADLLKGNRNALSALTNEQTLSADNEQGSGPPRRIPQSSNSRLENQNTENPRPHRYHKHSPTSEEYNTEPTVHRRLPPVNGPSRRKQNLDNRKPTRYREYEQEEPNLSVRERVKFVPTSPRRQPALQSPELPDIEKKITSTTESIEVTNSILPYFKESHGTFSDPQTTQNKKDAFSVEEENNRFASRISTTEHNEIVSQPAEPVRNSHEVIVTTKETSKQPVPLNVQETSIIDPLHNSPDTENQSLDHKRLRGKYLSRYRIPVTHNLGRNKEDSSKAKVRLPPPNFFHSTPPPRTVSKVDIAQETTAKPTEVPIHINSVQSDEITFSSSTPLIKYETPEVISKHPNLKLEPPFQDDDDDDGNIIVGKPKINFPEELKTQETEKKDEPMHRTIPFHTETPPILYRPKTLTARDEILEFLKTDSGAIRLARILASRNMTLAELIEHRERGSSQRHLAEIFKESDNTKTNATKNNEPENEESGSNGEIMNNDVMYNILKNFQQTISNNPKIKDSIIPSIHEMFGLLNENNKLKEENKASDSISSSTEKNTNNQSINEEKQIFNEQKASRESRIFDSLPSFTHQKPTSTIPPPIQKQNFQPHPIPSWKSYEHPSSIYSFEPLNPYFNPGQRHIVTSRLTTPPSNSPNNDLNDDIILLENFGQVRELGNKGKIHRDNDKRFDILYRNNIEDGIINDGGLPKDVKSAIIVSSAILGVAILGFLAIFVVCRWRQRQARRRYVDGIVNTRAKSPILMQPEGKNSNRSLSPVMVNSHDLYKRELSTDGEEDHMSPGARRYYLWRTIRKTLRYK